MFVKPFVLYFNIPIGIVSWFSFFSPERNCYRAEFYESAIAGAWITISHLPSLNASPSQSSSPSQWSSPSQSSSQLQCLPWLSQDWDVDVLQKHLHLSTVAAEMLKMLIMLLIVLITHMVLISSILRAFHILYQFLCNIVLGSKYSSHSRLLPDMDDFVRFSSAHALSAENRRTWTEMRFRRKRLSAAEIVSKRSCQKRLQKLSERKVRIVVKFLPVFHTNRVSSAQFWTVNKYKIYFSICDPDLYLTCYGPKLVCNPHTIYGI